MQHAGLCFQSLSRFRKREDASEISRALPKRVDIFLHTFCLILYAEGTTDAAIRGLAFHRYAGAGAPMPRFLKPVIIVAAQGRTLARIGKNEYNHGENICFVTGVNMPVASRVMEASEGKPYLAMSLHSDYEGYSSSRKT